MKSMRTISEFLRENAVEIGPFLICLFLLASSTVWSAPRILGQSSGEFSQFLKQLALEEDPERKSKLLDDFLTRTQGKALIEDSLVYFLFRGNVSQVSVAGDFNGWNPQPDTLSRLAGTALFYLAKPFAPSARFEYKLVVDSNWILDPINKQQAFGGYGANSEVWMPDYSPPKEIEYKEAIPHGSLDTTMISSKILGRTHPVIVYTPPAYADSKDALPVLFVTDGGEYISLARMPTVIDNLIADKRIRPVIAVFVDPRTDIFDSQTSKRMIDYAMSDDFIRFLIEELRPSLLKRYRLATTPDQTGIMGASLGGLIATYAALSRPNVFGLSAAQSPAYQMAHGKIFDFARTKKKLNVKFYIDTGTMRDAVMESRRMLDILKSQGYAPRYGEYPEGHNWVNWRARLDDILEYFWGL